MTSELKPTRNRKVPDPLPNMVSDEEMARSAAAVFEDDLADPAQVQADIDAAFPPALVPDHVRTQEYADFKRNEVRAAGRLMMGEPGLVARIAEVINGLPDVQPEGTNKFFNYKFISDKQVLGLLRPRLSKAGIVIVPETVEEGTYIELTTKAGATSRMTRMLVTFRVMDAYGGESFTGQALGYGDDAGDKGANKAYTAAFKNFLIKLCMIGGERDIEDDEDTDKRANDNAKSSRPINISQGSGIEGVKVGGRQSQITKPQLTAISGEQERLGINDEQLLNAARVVTGLGEKLDGGGWATTLTFQQAGDLLRALQAASPPEGGTNEESVEAGDAGPE